MMNETTPSTSNDAKAPSVTYGSNLSVNSAIPARSQDPELGNFTPTKSTSEPLVSPMNALSPKEIIHNTLNLSDLTERFTMENFRVLKNYVSQGERTFKLITMAACIILVLRGILGLVKNLFAFYLFGVIIDLLILMVAITCILYEYDERKIPIGIATYLHSELHIFSTPYGRSIIIIFIGLLLLQQPLGLDTLIGLIISCGGIYIYMNMRNAEIALAAMKTHISDEIQLRNLFDKCDVDNSGYLDREEVAKVCRELGTVLEEKELLAALTLLDTNGDGKVSFEEFKDWYEAIK